MLIDANSRAKPLPVAHPLMPRWARGLREAHPMSLFWRVLAVMALSATSLSLGPLSLGPMSSSLFAASSPGAPGGGAVGAHGVHKGTPKAGTGPARATESPGPGVPGIGHGQPVIGLGKSSPKPPSTLRTRSGQGPNGVAVRRPGLGPPGDLSARGTGSPHGMTASSGSAGGRTPQRGLTSPLGAGASIGGLPRRPAELNGSTIGAKGLAAARIAPSPKANTGINGTGLGRRN
jgi:hypothetical protein